MHPSKKHKTALRPETPLSLYKQALRLVRQQQCADVTTDAAVEEKLSKAIELLADRQQSTAKEQTVVHSLDLELSDEPLYLLANAHLQLGLLYQRQDKLEAAEEQYRQALKYFPRFVAALSALGQVLKAAATSAASLKEAQQSLFKAIDIAQQLSQEEGGLLVESNKACADELDAADAARSALAMLLCQSGREAEAAPHLKALGFKYRLSQEVLRYTVPKQRSLSAVAQKEQAAAGSSSGRNCSFLQAVDDALPPPMLQHLQHVFKPGANFWRRHAYGRVGYFSYYFPLDQHAASSSMQQLAHYLQQLGMQYFPDLKEAKFAEFWAHCRRHSSGHQLHFDSDAEGQGGVRHPILTAIVYLSDNTSTVQPQAACHHSNGTNASNGNNLNSSSKQGTTQGTHGTASSCCEANRAGQAGSCSCTQQDWVGGPTLMTDQVLGGALATQGWLAYPATNRVVFFDGRYLHGVIPGRGPSPSADGRRSTLMMAFWRDLKCRTPPGQGVGACMPMPETAEKQDRTWHLELQPLEDLGSTTVKPVEELQRVSAVWQSVEPGSNTAGAAYQYCFQGF